MCFATIFLLRQGVQMPLQFWSFRFGCGLAALRCLADLQSAGRASACRGVRFAQPAEWNSATQQSPTLRYEAQGISSPFSTLELPSQDI
jgi:hypothetical protein